MPDLPIEKLLPRANNSIYKLVSMAAMRALELSDGRRCLAENIDTEKFTTMALQEILQGKIEIKEAKISKSEKSADSEETKEDQKKHSRSEKVAKTKRVILGVTGSIAAYKAGEIIRRLRAEGLRVSVVMTQEAEHFITPLTLAGLSGEAVSREMFGQGGDAMAHITLAYEADLFLIAPATANIIGKLAHGIADNLLTCIALATKAPVVIVPAMNTQMYQNPIVQENCRKLKKNGAQFVEPVEGKLACGTMGQGHIADETAIVKTVLRTLK